MKDYSCYGESTIMYNIFEEIGTKTKYAVEFGASDGYWYSNIRMFLDECNWNGLQMEGILNSKNGVKSEFITKENINQLFQKYNVPQELDLLSIDIDGNDYWVWKELNYYPSVVIIEYNSNFNIGESYALKYNPNHNFQKSGGFYSASLTAFEKLGTEKGYFLHKEISYTNLIFVRNEFSNIIEKIQMDSVLLPRQHHGGKDLNKFIEV